MVIGSTSPIAISICSALAAVGCQRFHLIARNGQSNEQLAEELRQRYSAVVTTEQTDLFADALADRLKTVQVGEFDLYLLTAGSLGDAGLARTDPAEALKITSANFTGLIPWLTAIATPERLVRHARLWVFSSVAGDRGRPSNYHYGAAKAALTTFCEGLLLRCHGKPFAVRIIKAGYMATPMAAGAPPALCIAPHRVARILLRRPDRRGVEYLPWWWKPIMVLVRLLPPALAAKL
jgi:short-subunit dehydrogenase